MGRYNKLKGGLGSALELENFYEKLEGFPSKLDYGSNYYSVSNFLFKVIV